MAAADLTNPNTAGNETTPDTASRHRRWDVFGKLLKKHGKSGKHAEPVYYGNIDETQPTADDNRNPTAQTDGRQEAEQA